MTENQKLREVLRFTKKPVTIEAVQWDGTKSGIAAIEAAFPGIDTCALSSNLHREEVTHWRIRTLENGHVVSPGDWIIRGVKGEFYPCKPDIFAATYDPTALSLPTQAEPAAQEAVAWLHTGGHLQGRNPMWEKGVAEAYTHAKGWTPLYATPPASQEQAEPGQCAACMTPKQCNVDRDEGLACPDSATQTQAKPAAQEVYDEDDKWRDVALRFDRHRMQALWHLQAMIQDPAKHIDIAREFIKSPPAPQPAPASGELPPLPQGYENRPHDYEGALFVEGQMRSYAIAARAAAKGDV